MCRALEGIVELMGKDVVLEDIENPKLRRVLHSRLKDDNFNFWHNEGYKETNNARERYTKGHRDNHSEYHRDNYEESHDDGRTGGYDEDTGYRDHDPYSRMPSGHHDTTRHSDQDINRGYSEKVDRGYSEHTDHY